jgi:uncharacterized alkaline shock family protein YloU
MALEEPPRLGCGRSIDRLWAAIGQAPDPHEQQCEQCQAARARLERLREATRSLRESDLHDPALKPSPGTTEAIMGLARAEARRGRRVPLHSDQDGTTEVSEQALGSLVRSAAAAVPGIHARRCRIGTRPGATSPAGGGHPSPAAAEAGTHLVIDLQVAAAAGIDIPAAAEALRDEIATIIPARAGIGAGTVNIIVEDLYDA